MSQKTMIKTTIVMSAFLMMTPAVAAAQESEVEGTARAAAAAQATTPEARIDAAMEAAARAELPVSLLESKVREGQAKRVPMERVAAAVEARFKGLVRAQEAMREAGVRSASEGDLLVTSEALQAGVSQEAIVRVIAEAPAERRAVATAVLTDLVRLGYGSNTAWTRVNASLSNGPEALVNLRAEAAASLRARGLPATDVMGGVNGGLDL